MRTTADDHHSCFEFNSSSLEQTKGIQENSLAQFPSFMKQLLKSHLSGKFYLVSGYLNFYKYLKSYNQII